MPLKELVIRLELEQIPVEENYEKLIKKQPQDSDSSFSI